MEKSSVLSGENFVGPREVLEEHLEGMEWALT